MQSPNCEYQTSYSITLIEIDSSTEAADVASLSFDESLEGESQFASLDA